MTSDKNIDEIYTSIDVLMKNDCWNFLNDFFQQFAVRVWRTELDFLLAYATASLPGKSKIKSRSEFMRLCKEFHKDKGIWKGLE